MNDLAKKVRALRKAYIPFVFFLLIYSGKAFAQIKEGTFLISPQVTNLRLENTSSYLAAVGPSVTVDKEQQMSASFAPALGYFFVPDLCIGVTPGFSYQWATIELHYPSPSISTSFGFMKETQTETYFNAYVLPFARYYIPTNQSKSRFYAQLGLSYIKSFKSEIVYRRVDVNGKELVSQVTDAQRRGRSVELQLGYNHFFSERMAFQVALTTYYLRIREPSRYFPTGYFVQVNPEVKRTGITLNFGLVLLFPKKEFDEKKKSK